MGHRSHREGGSIITMATFENVETVMKRAIVLEDEAATMYASAAKAAGNAPIRRRLEEMAEQERGHKARLEEVLNGNVRWAIRKSKSEPVTDLRLSDHLESK